jgi:hypothetical protein
MLQAGDTYLATVVDIFEARAGSQRKAEARAKRKGSKRHGR